MVKAVTFDMGGTLAEGELDKKAFMREVLDYLSGLGFKVSARAYKRSLGRAMSKLQASRASGREMDFNSFYSLVLSGVGVEPREELLEGLKALYFKCFRSELVPGAREVVELLSKRYALGVISNAITTWPRAFLEAVGLAGCFKFIIISCEAGWRKPSRAIFKLALKELGLAAEQVVHVGDSPSEDIVGAKRTGMKAILVLREGTQLELLDVEPDAVVRRISELPRALELLDP
ncbi:MAG TPA: HAD family hydrolase [Candidatus Bathyarchaeota archaeon]|nr:HAD family hydrolase [Candidatus Bathyarchaeota archaeon]